METTSRRVKVLLITILAGARIVAGVFRFFHKAETLGGKHRVISTAHLSLMTSYAIASIVSYFAADWLSSQVFDGPEYGWLIRIAAIAVFAIGIFLVVRAFLGVGDI